jgi:hypothetical protein
MEPSLNALGIYGISLLGMAQVGLAAWIKENLLKGKRFWSIGISQNI